MNISELVTSIVEQAQAVESCMGDDNENPEVIEVLTNINGHLTALCDRIEDGEF